MGTKRAMVMATCAAVLAVMLMTAGPALAGGFSCAGQSVAQIESDFGKPVMVQVFNDGTETRFYNGVNLTGPGSYRYFVFKGDKVVADGVSAVLPAAPAEPPAYKVVKK